MWHYINKNISIQLYIHYILSMILPSPCLNEAGCLALKLHNSSDPALACWARLIQPKTSMYLKPLWMFSTTLLKFYRANIPGVRQWCFFLIQGYRNKHHTNYNSDSAHVYTCTAKHITERKPVGSMAPPSCSPTCLMSPKLFESNMLYRIDHVLYTNQGKPHSLT